ncbi:actin-binding Rho-activating protein [Brienomyrus brachyistius]|uniref:actin-binding Rho-activating protein n=1 Tax=Brienomyrus brachyistius TaxID=42636 RepID=UPI0020B3C91A|nr:actin-binding Rho-activating protein [Brienomyrus brachyistius]
MATTVQDSRPFTRVVRKIRCVSMVNGLAKSWQSWANQHSVKQETIPSGWVPDSIQENEEKKESEAKPSVVSRVVKVDGSDDCKIKTSVVTKSVTPKKSDCGNDLVSSIKEKIDSNQLVSEAEKPFLGSESPTRRRYCSSKASNGVRAWNQVGKEEPKMGSRSSSLDTEDSGLGEEAGLSDNSDYKNSQNDDQGEKRKIRQKIKVTTMGDLKNKWQQWSEQHIEGQKLNPFSEEFNYEHAMAVRLQKGDPGYGRPKEGSKTEERARRAEKHIHREMEEMCYIIRDMGVKGKDGKVRITFGRLFDRYVKISDKVVGILLRCRKHGMVCFEGEMLWKGQDDNVVITLVD